MQVFTYGGSVRDSILGRKPKDIDYCIVTGDPDAAFELFQAVHPGIFAAYPARRVIRTTMGDYSFHRSVECKSSDLTINSLLQSNAGHIIDPTGKGLQDLVAGVLRPSSPTAIIDDPRRVWRAIRFEHKLKFKPTESLLYQCRCAFNVALQQVTPNLLSTTTKTAITNTSILTDEQRNAALSLFPLPKTGKSSSPEVSDAWKAQLQKLVEHRSGL